MARSIDTMVRGRIQEAGKPSAERTERTEADLRMSKKGLEEYPGDEELYMSIQDALDSGRITTSLLRDQGLWRPEETMEVLGMIADGTSVLIKGRAGTGKGAVINGVRFTLQMLGTPYSYFDGHYQTTPTEEVTESIQSVAKKKDDENPDGIALIDSMDYLYAGTRRMRKKSIPDFREHTDALFEALVDVPIVVGTVHEDEWGTYLGDDERMARFATFIASKGLQVYENPEAFGSRNTAEAFLTAKGLSENEAALLLDIASNDEAHTAFTERYGDAAKWDEFVKLMKHYATLKLITQDVYKEHEVVLEQMRSGDRTTFFNTLFTYVFEKDKRLTFHPVLRS